MSFRHQYNPWSPARISQLSYSYAASVLLAIDDFNARDAVVVPELEDLKRTGCTVHFPEPAFADSETDRAVSVQALWDVMEAGRPVCAVLGPLRDDEDDAALFGLLPVLEALDIPLLVHSIESDALARGEDRNIAALLTLSAAGRARAMVEYLSSREFLAHWHPSGADQDEALAEEVERIGKEGFDLQTFLFVDRVPPAGVSEDDYRREKLEEMRDSGVTTIFVAIRHPHELPAFAALLEKVGMLSTLIMFTFCLVFVPFHGSKSFGGFVRGTTACQPA